MWNEREEGLIQRYREEIRQQYSQGSKVRLLTTLRREPDAQASDFLKIARRFKIPRDFFEEDHIIIVRPFSDFVELSEYQFIIDELKEASRNRSRYETLPTVEMIDHAIRSISGLTQPDFIIIPIAFYVDLHQKSRNSRLPVIQYEDRQTYYNHGFGRCRVLWSNKFINLNEIIIGNSQDSEWLFKSANGENRLTVEFHPDDSPLNIILLVQTVFRFHPPPPERIAVIEFPENLCNIEQRS